MTDERSITRRDSLKRIAASGALLGGTGFAAGTATASEHKRDNIRLVAICYESERSRFRVDNENKRSVEVTWDVYGTDQTGSLTVPGKESKYFWVDAEDGQATVRLFYKGDQIDVKHANDQKECEPESPKEALELEAKCYIDERAYRGDADLTVDPDEPGETATYCFSLTVGDDADGNSLNEIVADFCGTGVDVSNVEDDDVSAELNGDDVTNDLDEVSDSNNGQTLTLTFGGNYDLEQGDSIDVCLDNVQNPEMPGLYPARFTLNDEESSATVFTIGDVDGMYDEKKKRKKDDDFHGEAKFCVHNHYSHDAKVVWKNEYKNQAGVRKVPAGGTRCFWVELDRKGKGRASLYYNSKRIDEKDANTDDLCRPKGRKIHLKPVCYRDGEAKFRVRNYNRQAVPVSWTVDHDDNGFNGDDDCPDYEGTFYVGGNDSREFWVDLDDNDDNGNNGFDDLSVSLWFMGERLARKGVKDKKCKPDDHKKALELEPICYRSENGKEKKHGEAKYYVYNHYKKDVKIVWRNAYTNQAGVLEIPGREKRCFWADLDKKGKGRVTIHHNKKKVGEADANTDVVCDDNGDNGDNGNNDSPA
ncbi:hypothetical protein [Natronosalvus vescus]|uniref:hypothetical protein n=1 Tax=Natronosalvus vescus TaxID=2953881 RepID=UPI00209139B8|nr:hypothetical protein [Natronosalvus vescus]